MQAVAVMIRGVHCAQVVRLPSFAGRRFRFALLAALVCTAAWALPSTASAQNGAPVIDGFTAIHVFGNVWEFKGHVSDENPAGCTLVLSGAPLDGPHTVVVQSNGAFSVILPIYAAGTVYANATDEFGLVAEEVGVDVGF